MKPTQPLYRGVLLIIGSLWTVSLGSCTIYKDPYLVKYDDTSQREEFEALIARKRIAAASAPTPAPSAVVEPVKIRIDACGRFAMPAGGAIPRLTPKQIEDVATANDTKELKAAVGTLMDELERIYKYTHDEEIALAAANAKHLKTCRKVTVEK